MFKTLADEGINIQMISTSEIKISVVIDEKYLELAVRVLHKAFELDKAPRGCVTARVVPARFDRAAPFDAAERAPGTIDAFPGDVAEWSKALPC